MDTFLSYLGPASFGLTLLIAVRYSILIYKIYKGWSSIPGHSIPEKYKPTKKTSVVIAARNEEENIGSCIQSILDNDFPPEYLEIIVVDDHSEDQTANIVKAFSKKNISLLKAKYHGKKQAINQAIAQSTGVLILCTDADCLVSPTWLMNQSSFHESKAARIVAAPIRYSTNNSVLDRFQYLDSINNMCVTGYGIHTNKFYMANGANLTYEKSLFEELGGFRRNEKLASGDDMFLIQTAADKDPFSVSYLKSKEAIVNTKTASTWAELIKQRKRWATKSSEYSSKNIMKIQGYVFAFTALIIINLLLGVIGCKLCLSAALTALAIKWTTDYVYLSKLSDFFDNREPLRSFILTSVVFMIYILLAAWWALFPSSYEWKGRETE